MLFVVVWCGAVVVCRRLLCVVCCLVLFVVCSLLVLAVSVCCLLFVGNVLFVVVLFVVC